MVDAPCIFCPWLFGSLHLICYVYDFKHCIALNPSISDWLGATVNYGQTIVGLFGGRHCLVWQLSVWYEAKGLVIIFFF